MAKAHKALPARKQEKTEATLHMRVNKWILNESDNIHYAEMRNQWQQTKVTHYSGQWRLYSFIQNFCRRACRRRHRRVLWTETPWKSPHVRRARYPHNTSTVALSFQVPRIPRVDSWETSGMCIHTHEYAYSRYRSSIDIVVPSMFLFNSVRKYIGDMYLYVYYIYVCVRVCACVYAYVYVCAYVYNYMNGIS